MYCMRACLFMYQYNEEIILAVGVISLRYHPHSVYAITYIKHTYFMGATLPFYFHSFYTCVLYWCICRAGPFMRTEIRGNWNYINSLKRSTIPSYIMNSYIISKSACRFTHSGFTQIESTVKCACIVPSPLVAVAPCYSFTTQWIR